MRLRRRLCLPFVLGFCCLVSAQGWDQWPTDNEVPGMMGCKFFRYRGWWETKDDTLDAEESTEAVCLTVAMASIMNFHRWPRESFFDGSLSAAESEAVPVSIAHRWQYGLINGPGGRAENCYEDNPGKRFQPGRPEWTGIDEIRKLMYVVERAYGRDHELLRVASRGCDGMGYYSLHYILRNRLGYPGATSVLVKNPQCKKMVITDLVRGLPVLGAKCEHSYVIDGVRKDPHTGAVQFHMADYVNGEETMGWFSWPQMLHEGMVQVVVGLSPDVLVGKRAKTVIDYYWGNGYVPNTSHQTRQGFVRLTRPAGTPLGRMAVSVVAQHRDPNYPDKQIVLCRSTANLTKPTARIPARGTFRFDVAEMTKVEVIVQNQDTFSKKIRVVFHDFESTHTIEAGDERSLIPD
jgi:hypothetical protein